MDVLLVFYHDGFGLEFGVFAMVDAGRKTNDNGEQCNQILF